MLVLCVTANWHQQKWINNKHRQNWVSVVCTTFGALSLFTQTRYATENCVARRYSLNVLCQREWRRTRRVVYAVGLWLTAWSHFRATRLLDALHGSNIHGRIVADDSLFGFRLAGKHMTSWYLGSCHNILPAMPLRSIFAMRGQGANQHITCNRNRNKMTAERAWE